MAVSLLEAATIAAANGQDGPAGVMMTFDRSAPLLRAMPIESIDGNAYAWTREVSTGTNAFRNVNEAYSESTGQSETRSVPLKIIGGDLDIDLALLQTMGSGIKPQKLEAKAADLAQRIAYSMVKGATNAIGGATADPKGFDGLQTQYGGGFGSTAVVDGGENASQIIANAGAADALSMRDLDIAILACERPTHLILPRKMILNITGYLRNSSSITQAKSEYGEMVTTYNGLTMIPSDPLGTISGLEPQAFNENNDSTCSIYVVSMSDTGLHLVQHRSGIQYRPQGELQTKPVDRTRVEWLCNIVAPHPRCVVRLYNIADLVAVA
jgi:hypothetical protein